MFICNIYLRLFICGLGIIEMSDNQRRNDVEKINVGGIVFTTTTQTLSMLSLLTCLRDQDGNVFVDRDGEMFGYILNFCRHQKLILPEDFSKFELLEKEAEYYGLHTLVNEIKREKQMKEKKENHKYHFIEVVEVRRCELYLIPSIETWLTGREEDIYDLPSGIANQATWTTGKSGYKMLRFNGFDKRIIISEVLSKSCWYIDHTDMSSYCTSYEQKGLVLMDQVQTYRDRWKKPL